MTSRIQETSFRVRYAETDRMGVAYHANYLVWMEIGRVEFCRAAGIRYRDVEDEDGLALAVVEAQCRFRAPAHYDDEVTVRTRVAAVRRKVVEFAYEILSGDKLLATGMTRHVWVGPDFRPASLPVKYHGAFGLAPAEAPQPHS